ncbi:hypothetical protein BASA60_002321 [Batrachochytrium salamandrivorans]|nr:hypothetical protein BASA60_002321 [Batrachochytrium salamandrivorans]
MVKRFRADTLVTNLAQLQNKIKRDAVSYKDEFLQQLRHFESTLAIFNLKPQDSVISQEFAEQILFISHVAPCYPAETKDFPEKLINLLSNHYQLMAPDVRKTMVQALILMRNRGIVQPTTLLGLFFTLFRCKDKTLRQMLHSHIVSDIKNSNAKSKNNSMNKTLQNFMYTMLNDTNEVAAKKSLEVMIELYKKNVWNDAKTVNVIAEACFSPAPKIVASAIHFFLGTNDKDDESDEEEGPDMDSMRHAFQINKKKKSRMQMLEKAKATVRRKERNKNRAETFNFSALHLVNDPQGFAEKIFGRLRQAASKNAFRFELRMHMMNLVSRLIGVHRLILLGFYEFLIPYLKPHQRDVTLILTYAAQSSHDMVPPDALESVVRAIADHFIWSNCSSDVVTAGLNSLREICVRCPLAMPDELLKSLLDDYKNHREKGPMNAARSLLGLYREINPEMLRKKDRGKAATLGFKTFKAKKYGEINVMDNIDGVELLDDDEFDQVDSEFDSDVSNDDEEDVPELVSDDELVDSTGGNVDGEEIQASDDDEAFSDVDDDEEDDENDEDEDEEEGDDDEEEVATSLPSDATSSKTAKSPIKKRKPGVTAEKLLTDEDFARIRERQSEIEAERLAGMRGKKPRIESDSEDNDPDIVDVSRILSGNRKKMDYAARMETIKAGREGREFGSRRGKDERTSLTNKVKSKRNKAFMMIIHKREVRGKAQRSLYEKQRVMRAHIKKQKMKGN